MPDWVLVKQVKNLDIQSLLDLDAGEASAIALALESEPSLLILDDDKGRKAARRLNLTVTGTLGLLVKAKQLGFITSVKSVIEKIQQTNFRYSETVLNEILRLANESNN